MSARPSSVVLASAARVSAALLKLYAPILREAVSVFFLSPRVLASPHSLLILLGPWLLSFRLVSVRYCSWTRLFFSFCGWLLLVAFLFLVIVGDPGWAFSSFLERSCQGCGFLLVKVCPWCQFLCQCLLRTRKRASTSSGLAKGPMPPPDSQKGLCLLRTRIRADASSGLAKGLMPPPDLQKGRCLLRTRKRAGASFGLAKGPVPPPDSQKGRCLLRTRKRAGAPSIGDNGEEADSVCPCLVSQFIGVLGRVLRPVMAVGNPPFRGSGLMGQASTFSLSGSSWSGCA